MSADGIFAGQVSARNAERLTGHGEAFMLLLFRMHEAWSDDNTSRIGRGGCKGRALLCCVGKPMGVHP